MTLKLRYTEKDLKKLISGLVIIEIILVSIHIVVSLLGIPIERFNLNGEANIPTWFSSTQLFMIGVVFLLSAHHSNKHHHPSPLFLSIVGIGFIFLSVDEAAIIHEHITGALKHIEWIPRFGHGRGIWIFLYFLIGLTLLIIGYREMLESWKYYKREIVIFIIGSIIFVFGAVGLEIIKFEVILKYPFNLLQVVFEEFFEMLGATVILSSAILFAFHKLK